MLTLKRPKIRSTMEELIEIYGDVEEIEIIINDDMINSVYEEHYNSKKPIMKKAKPVDIIDPDYMRKKIQKRKEEEELHKDDWRKMVRRLHNFEKEAECFLSCLR